MLKVAAFTQGRNNPNSRFRVRQYVSALAQQGILLRELMAPLNSSPPVQKWLRPLWGGASLVCNLERLAISWRYDACLIQREFLSTLLTLEHLTKKPRIFDVDDAIFVYRGGWAARRLAQLCDAVICGNAYLADWFSRWNPNTTIIPTAVDTEKYAPRIGASEAGSVIGWIGLSANYPYLVSIERALAQVFEAHPEARLRVVADAPPTLKLLPTSRVDWVRWTEHAEAREIQSMDIGIMPLDDNSWTRGKCSYKMLQYMACGLPVVVSPVGMNAEVLAMGECGFGASTESEWFESLVALLENSDLRIRRGAVGRRLVESTFSVKAVAPKLARCIRGETGRPKS